MNTINPIKICHAGFAGIESSCGPIICFLIVPKSEFFKDKRIMLYNPSCEVDENYIKKMLIAYSSGTCIPKIKQESAINKAINAAFFSALSNLVLKRDGVLWKTNTIICEEGIIKNKFSDIMLMDLPKKNIGPGIIVSNAMAEQVRRRYIDSICEVEPILKVWHLNENYGELDKKHKKAIKENGISFFHRKDI